MSGGYRDGTQCEFCDELASGDCPRCQCHTCATHGTLGGPFCAICQKEKRDDDELAAFKGSVTHPEQGSGPRDASGMPLFEMAIGAVGRAILGANQDEEIPFAKRTPEDIRVWRQTAGVKTRR